MLYVDPDGEFFIIDDILVAAVWAGIQAGLTSAAINAAAQYVLTGSVNWNSVGQSFVSGALSGALSNAIGGVGQALKQFGGESLIAKTMAHGVSGGLQSMANGGNFGSGFASGAIGNLAGGMGGTDLLTRTAYAGLAAGVTSWATGGDFATGFQAGATNEMYNWGMHEGAKFGGDVWKGVGEIADKLGKAKDIYMQDPGAQAIERFFNNPLVDVFGEAGNIPLRGKLGTGITYINLFFMVGKYPSHAIYLSESMIIQGYKDEKYLRRLSESKMKGGGGGGARGW